MRDVTYGEGRGPWRAWSMCSGAGLGGVFAGLALCGAGPARRAGRWRWRRQSLRRRRWRLWGVGRSAAVRGGRAGGGREPQAGARRSAPGAEAVERLRGTRERGAERTEVTGGSGPGGAASASGARAGAGQTPLWIPGAGGGARGGTWAAPCPRRTGLHLVPSLCLSAELGPELRPGSTEGSGRPPGSEWGLPVRAHPAFCGSRSGAAAAPCLPWGLQTINKEAPADGVSPSCLSGAQSQLQCEGFRAEIQGGAVGGIKYHFVSVWTARLSKSGLILIKSVSEAYP